MAKEIFLTTIICVLTVFFGYVFAVFVAEILLNSQPLAEMFVAGLVIYLCIIVVISTRIILRKISNNKLENKSKE